MQNRLTAGKPIGALLLLGLLAMAACAPARPPATGAQLAGRAVLPATTAVAGPTSGQFIATGPAVSAPFLDRQPVQGFSGLLPAANGALLVVTDNGFGTRETSPDFLLRVYRLRPEFPSGSVTVEAVFTLHDPDRHVDFPIVAAMDSYPSDRRLIEVDTAIARHRLLTGADFDIESFASMPDGSFWFGDEFGPFLVHTDGDGRVLQPPVSLPGVLSPQHPHLGDRPPNAAQSGGFEGMARSVDGHRLYPILEKPLEGDPPQQLNIYEFDPDTSRFVGEGPFRKYRLDSAATGVSDFVALTERTFLLIERDDGQAATASLKKIFLVDFDAVDREGFLQKRQIVDLLRIDDPKRIGDLHSTKTGDGRFRFAFPFETPEGLAVVGDSSIVVVNDNNYPFGRGRDAAAPDETELILLEIAVPEP